MNPSSARPQFKRISLGGATGHASAGESAIRRMGDATIKLKVKAIPGSSRDCVVGWLGNTLKVRVTAPAERGKANAAIETMIAEALGVPRTCAQVVAGTTSPRKVVEIIGLSEAEVYRRLSRGAA